MNIYVHVPFCVKKCHYCYYYSFVPSDKKVVERYLDCLERELELKSQKFKLKKNREIDTLFIGGGTPNYLSDPQLERLFLMIKKHIDVSHLEEFIIELNPASCTPSQLKLLKKYGVSRISLGIQTLNDDINRSLNRHHANNYEEVIRLAKQMGFWVNLDFMTGLPGQTKKDVVEAIKFVEKNGPTSSVWCGLRSATPAMKKHSNFPTYEEIVEMHKMIRMASLQGGYHQMLTEYFSKEDKLPIFISEWWTADRSIGFGLSAFSKIDDVFYKNTENMEQYARLLEKGELPVKYVYKLNPEEAAFVNLIWHLKNGKPADLLRIKEKYAIDLAHDMATDIKALEKDGLVRYDGRELAFTPKGFLISTQIADVLFKRMLYLGKLINTAFNYFDQLPSPDHVIRKYFIITKENKNGKVFFSSPDKKSTGFFNKYA
jgi:oxygen-independent coproporphyrinogen-3 oxidase